MNISKEEILKYEAANNFLLELIGFFSTKLSSKILFHLVNRKYRKYLRFKEEIANYENSNR